jgi:DNA-binding transcriptional LysR family regulator
MELRHLRYFVAVAEELNFSRAAQKLHIAQPPLSQQIQDLEIELGVQLFERTKRRVRLTEAGKVFLEEVEKVFAQVDRAIEASHRASRGEIGKLAIAFNSSATYSVLPDLLHQFHQQYPEVELILQELTTSQQLDKLQQNQIDVGLLYLPIDTKELTVISVLKEPLMVALSASHPLAKQSTIAIADLSDRPFILPPPQLGEGLYTQIMQYFEQINFYPKTTQTATLLQTAIALVAGGVGTAIVPASLQNLQRKGVVYRAIVPTAPEIEIALAWPNNNASPVLQKFLDLVKISDLYNLNFCQD